MGKHSKLVVFACLTLMSAAPTMAQDNSLAPVRKREFNHRAEIVSVYDKAKDITSVVMGWYQITEEPKELDLFEWERTDPLRILIRAGFGYPGRVLKSTPPAIELDVGFAREGKSLFKGKEPPELIAVVDGERISLGKTLLQASRTLVNIRSSPNKQVSSEVLEATFTYEGLLRLVNAKKVGMKLGGIEFELKDRHLEALRDLASRMVP